MQKETAFGRTKEEAILKLSKTMMYKHPDAIFSCSNVEVSVYGDEKSEFKFIAEYTF